MDHRWLMEEDMSCGSEAGDFVRSPEQSEPKRKLPSTWRRLITFAATFGIAFGITLYFLTIFGVSRSERKSFLDVYEESPCGNTPEEASSRGCKFEMQNLAWMPEECYDAQLSEAWNEMPWQFWLDPELKRPIAKSEVVKGFVPHVHVTYLQHKHHCMFMWHKFHRAVQSNRKMDNWTSSLPHTEHCINEIILYMSNGTEKDSDVNSEIFLKYTPCNYGWKVGYTR